MSFVLSGFGRKPYVVVSGEGLRLAYRLNFSRFNGVCLAKQPLGCGKGMNNQQEAEKRPDELEAHPACGRGLFHSKGHKERIVDPPRDSQIVIVLVIGNGTATAWADVSIDRAMIIATVG